MKNSTRGNDEKWIEKLWEKTTTAQQLNPHQLVGKGSDIFIYVCLEVHIYINFSLNCKQSLISRDLESIA